MSQRVIDTSRTCEIHASPIKGMLAVLGAIAFVVAGAWMTQTTEGTGRYSPGFLHLVGYVAILVFGFFGGVGLWRLLTQRGPVITISPLGLRDIRVSPDTVVWTAIQSIGTWKLYGQEFMVLALKPGEEQKLELTRTARWSRKANAKLGADGLSIGAQGTRIARKDLLATTMAYVQRFGNLGTD